jgi:hypothetical protein
MVEEFIDRNWTVRTGPWIQRMAAMLGWEQWFVRVTFERSAGRRKSDRSFVEIGFGGYQFWPYPAMGSHFPIESEKAARKLWACQKIAKAYGGERGKFLRGGWEGNW